MCHNHIYTKVLDVFLGFCENVTVQSKSVTSLRNLNIGGLLGDTLQENINFKGYDGNTL